MHFPPRVLHYQQRAKRAARFALPLLGIGLGLLIFCTPSVRAANVVVCRKLLKAGRYEECVTTSLKAIATRQYGEDWRILCIRGLLITGHDDEAAAVAVQALKRYPWSIRLRLVGLEAFRLTGKTKLVDAQLPEIQRLLKRSPWRYTDAVNLIAGGDALLKMRAEPRTVLLDFYDRAKKQNSRRVEPFLAIGQLALDKHDDALAAEEFRAAAKLFPTDPDVFCGLARALQSSDRAAADQALKTALEHNPRHIPSLLLQVDQMIDSERYEEAEATIAAILKINRRQPQAWAYRAVLAHLAADLKAEQMYRAAARGRLAVNPQVDHLIGRKLSRNYRFREGAAYQRLALAQDADFVPATIQLAQDLLRLGQEDEGWRLAQSGFQRDGYDVVSYNLVTLQENLAKFRTLEDGDFIVRMDAREAGVYGDRVLALLQRAKKSLCEKYGLELTSPVIVEIFADQADFAVRTFGMPGGAGYLGVCFGNVITANSPAGQAANPTNWESVLWHEFCHTVTLNLTHNRMPRWLSEGISVYEEKLADGRWGQSMTPRYREWILKGELTPISELSGAFLSPPSGLHLQFAYYESSLVVEYLVKTHGFEALMSVLHDLGAGVPINQALERRTDGLAALESGFVAFARQRAEELAPTAEWNDSSTDVEDVVRIKFSNVKDSNNIRTLTAHVQQLIKAREWEAAKPSLEKLIRLYPENVAAGNPYQMLAQVHRELDETAEEILVLERLSERAADAVDAYLRLMELHAERKDWKAVEKNALRLLAVNPLLLAGHEHLGSASRELKKPRAAIAAYRAVLALGTPDVAETHFQLARLLQQDDAAAAKTHLLRALEEAPRFRAAHRLLLKIHRQSQKTETAETDKVETTSSPTVAPLKEQQ